MNQAALALDQTYLLIDDGPRVTRVEGGPAFWAGIETRDDLADKRLMLVSHQDGAGLHWEMHPAGDEILFLVSGALDVVMEIDGGERQIPLQAGATAIVPAGIWHTLDVHVAGDLLSITRGAGTQVR
jgi:mannose-6-phosphate isomerase-like protein (cupin superfamily)